MADRNDPGIEASDSDFDVPHLCVEDFLKAELRDTMDSTILALAGMRRDLRSEPGRVASNKRCINVQNGNCPASAMARTILGFLAHWPEALEFGVLGHGSCQSAMHRVQPRTTSSGVSRPRSSRRRHHQLP